MTTVTADQLEAVKERLRTDTPYWARNAAKIVNKQAKLVPFDFNAAQLDLHNQLEAQRLEGLPQRAIVLKARQVGISTGLQGKLIQRTTQVANQQAVVVAHDRETGAKLYKMGERMYQNLPAELKPEIRNFGRARFMHFAEKAIDVWQSGSLWPDSTYLVDTAGEFQSGRGGTYQLVHCSEFAFWPQPLEKITALKAAVPRDPDTLLVIESTAQGHNLFKDLWDDAEQGRSEYIAFFWPWWKEETYTLAFVNDAEKEAFRVADGPYGEEEPDLVQRYGLSLEQLHWRRETIANECSGKLDKFKEEYPTTADEAFLASGRQVFDPHLVRGIVISCEISDPKRPSEENPGPQRGVLAPDGYETRVGRLGTIEVPKDPLWVERNRLDSGEPTRWKIWPDESFEDGKPAGDYVVSCDPSGGKMEETDEPDFHGVQVIDHRTKRQVATYRSRIDPDLLAVEVYLAALYFHNAWVVVERTGGFGLPVARRVWMDFHYPYLYQSTSVERAQDRPEKKLGWDTNRRTKPIIEASLAEMIRDGTHGIRDRDLAHELLTYVRDPKGKTGAEKGRYDDLVVSYMIAQQVARELPIKPQRMVDGRSRRAPRIARDAVTGY